MLVKIASANPKNIIEVLDGKESMGVTFKHTGKIQGLFIVFDCSANDIKEAKIAAKKLTKADPRLKGMTVSVLPY